MKRTDNILGWISFALLLFAITLSPWFFGAWEMWWFWPFTTIIFASTCFFALRLLIHGKDQYDIKTFSLFSGVGLSLLSFILFLIYVAIRFLQAEVFMSAERSFLLFLTPFLIGINILFGFNTKQRRILWITLFINIFALGLYGVINHFVTHNTLVMWAPGYEQYFSGNRATGSFFCPDHFAGIMELGLCLALPLILDLRSSRGWKIAGIAMSALAITAVLLSKSRGAGLTVIVLGLAVIIWGGTQLPKIIRWYLRGALLLAGIAMIIALGISNLAYVERFKSYFGTHSQEISISAKVTSVKKRLNETTRGRMYGAAVRAWQSSPTVGIGAGMHENLWFHFAATDDGDIENNIWPTLTNHYFHSYEVHNDWLQLLEEYGSVGFILFLIPFGLWFNVLRKELPTEAQINDRVANKPLFAAAFAGLLACVCMGFHSLGDFNLQMPAITWVLAAIVTLPISQKMNN